MGGSTNLKYNFGEVFSLLDIDMKEMLALDTHTLHKKCMTM